MIWVLSPTMVWTNHVVHEWLNIIENLQYVAQGKVILFPYGNSNVSTLEFECILGVTTIYVYISPGDYKTTQYYYCDIIWTRKPS
jgi:hypothetical protein